MRILSWNVNGIRAAVKKDFIPQVHSQSPDVICLQETKAQPEEVSTALRDLDSYHIFANSADRKGYASTAILSREKPLSVKNDMGIDLHDQEGRIITTEFSSFYITTVYTPNSGRGQVRLDYRKQWDRDFLSFLQNLERTKPVIVCGDLNVAHQDIDLARPKSNYNKTSGYTQEEIDGFQTFLDHGFIDTFRHLYPEEVKYSWWSYMFSARKKNIGWRIDYFLVSPALLERVQNSEILNNIEGSDHCPILLTLKD